MNKKKEEKEKGIGVWLFLVALLSIFLLFSQLQTSDYWGKLNACELDLEKIKNPVRPYDEEYFTDCIQGQLMVCVMEKVWDEWNTSQIGDVVTCYGLDESCAEETEEPLMEKHTSGTEWTIIEDGKKYYKEYYQSQLMNCIEEEGIGNWGENKDITIIKKTCYATNPAYHSEIKSNCFHVQDCNDSCGIDCSNEWICIDSNKT